MHIDPGKPDCNGPRDGAHMHSATSSGQTNQIPPHATPPHIPLLKESVREGGFCGSSRVRMSPDKPLLHHRWIRSSAGGSKTFCQLSSYPVQYLQVFPQPLDYGSRSSVFPRPFLGQVHEPQSSSGMGVTPRLETSATRT